MAVIGDIQTNRCIIHWKIENIEFSSLRSDKPIDSETFIADAFGGSKWKVILYPKVLRDGEYYLDLFLRRSYSCTVAGKIVINFRLLILDENGSTLKRDGFVRDEFMRGSSRGNPSIEEHAKVFLKERETFLPDGNLTVQCMMWNEYVDDYDPKPIRTRTVFSSDGTYQNVSCSNGIISPKHNQFSITPNVYEFKRMYEEGLFSDIKLQTSTKIFPAHKCVLSARSPAFRKLLSTDLKEQNRGCIEITGLDDDTVHRMLLFLYTSTLEDLQFETAIKLYVAADRYECFFLRGLCSLFLMSNLSVTKVGEIISLADQHQNDVELKFAVQDFIFKHGEEVFRSQEWKDFMDTNIKLAGDIMQSTLCKIEIRRSVSSHRYSPC